MGMHLTPRLVVLAVLAAWSSALRLAPRCPRAALPRAARRRVSVAAPRMLFGGAPPPEEAPAASPGGGGKTMSLPGVGDISEDEMKMAMAFREKLSARMQETKVEASALGGKVRALYDGQGQPTGIEIDEAALAEGEAKVSAAVAEAAKAAQADALGKMKTIMAEMQQDLAKEMGAPPAPTFFLVSFFRARARGVASGGTLTRGARAGIKK